MPYYDEVTKVREVTKVSPSVTKVTHATEVAKVPPGVTNNSPISITPKEKKIRKAFSSALGLPANAIGLNCTFLRLGGDSVQAVRLAAKLTQIIGSVVTALQLLGGITISELAALPRTAIGRTLSASPLSWAETDSPLSFAQERFWFLNQFIDPDLDPYNIPFVFDLEPAADLMKVIDSLERVIGRHEVLRTIIVPNELGRPSGRVLDVDYNFPVPNIGMSAKLADAIEGLGVAPFRLSAEIPVRATLLGTDSAATTLSLQIHHIALDYNGWSMDIFLREFFRAYDGTIGSTNIEPNPSLLQYRHYAAWERSSFESGHFDDSLSYWRTQLVESQPLNFPTDFPRPKVFNHSGQELDFKIDESRTADLRALARSWGVSLFSLMISAYFLTLRVFSGQDDIVVGTPMSHRDIPETLELIGPFLNPVPLRVTVEGQATLKRFVKQVQGTLHEAMRHKLYPFDRLLDALALQKDPSVHPLFQAFFAFDTFGRNSVIQSADRSVRFRKYRTVYRRAKFDLYMQFEDIGDRMCGFVNFATSLFHANTISSFIKTYKCILAQYTDSARLVDFQFLPADDMRALVTSWKGNSVDWNGPETLHGLFEYQVSKNPEAIAVQTEFVSLTYAELNSRAEILADSIRRAGGGWPDSIIALVVAKSEMMLVGMLGIMKGGGAYVPIDPNQPSQRIGYILRDTKTKLVVGDEQFRTIFIDFAPDLTFLTLDKDAPNRIEPVVEPNPVKTATGQDLAYVMYTSGTSGLPKGVLVEHRGVVNTIRGLSERNFGQADSEPGSEVILQFSNYVFDASVEQIWLALANGHVCLIPPQTVHEDKERFYEYLSRNGVTHLDGPSPTLMAQYDFSRVPTMRRIVVGGEETTVELYQRIARPEHFRVVQVYGITETSVTSAWNELSSADVSIGKPLPNTTFLILNRDLKPIPNGAVGELHIGGVGVSRGYLGLESLTREKFIPNPFGAGNDRLYKTGDLFRVRPNGSLEFKGRTDFQVKVRGFRVELNEIVKTMSRYPGMGHVVAVPKERSDGGGKFIAAYYAAETETDPADLKRFVEKSLPAYSVPSVFMQIESIPEGPSGKVDIRALPEPIQPKSAGFVRPRDWLEEEIVSIWAYVLGIDSKRLGTADNFFTLGGDSMVALRIVHEMKENLGLEVTVLKIFLHQDIGGLYEEICLNNLR